MPGKHANHGSLVWVRCGIGFGSVWARFGVGFWDRSGIVLGSVWLRFRIGLWSVWDRFGVGLGDHFGIDLELVWDQTFIKSLDCKLILSFHYLHHGKFAPTANEQRVFSTMITACVIGDAHQEAKTAGACSTTPEALYCEGSAHDECHLRNLQRCSEVRPKYVHTGCHGSDVGIRPQEMSKALCVS
jgi:hypothetical protein